MVEDQQAEVLRAPVGVMHQAAVEFGLAGIQRLLQRVEHEVRPHRTADPPADDVAREHVHDEGDIDEALPGRDIGEVRHPQRVRPLGAELPVHPVQRARRLGIGHGGAHRLAASRPAQPGLPHSSGRRPGSG